MKKFRIPFLITVIGVAAFMVRGKIPHQEFDSQVWKAAHLRFEENISLRWDMMNDLRNRYHLVGMTKKEIVDLLGSPPDSDGAEFRYYLGYSKRGINTGSLIISFNDKDIVTSAIVWQG